MGKELIKIQKKQLLSILKKLSFKRKHVILSSGKISNYYFDGRITSLNHQGAYRIASIILNMIKYDKITAIGGLTLGADPIIGAVVALSAKTKIPLNGFIVRKQEKKHGMKNLIEGFALKKSSRVLIVDDVVTTGSSTIQAIKAVKKIGCKIVRVIAIVDRLEGAAKNIAKHRCRLESIFTIKDFNL
ncbi:MAG: orotate phosphoribosyltransferase [Candidatus Omnitrophota bacterium]